jgi:antitoxin HigA-1
LKAPCHPGELVEASLEELKVTVAVAAKALGVTRQQLYNVINGRSAVSAAMAVRLEQAIGSTADTWLQMQANYDLAQVRLRKRPVKVKRLTPKTLLAAE